MGYKINDWIADLRSGNFSQVKHYLYDNEEDGYCCLGVLGKQLGHNISIRRDDDTGDEFTSGMVVDGKFFDNTELPSNLDFILRLDEGRQAKVLLVELMDQLAGMNDRGVDFDSIANFIDDVFNKCDMELVDNVDWTVKENYVQAKSK
jgi:hypothetical protein